MSGQLKRLMKHYGIDEAKPQASKQLIKRIKADMSRYETQAQEANKDHVTHSPRTDKVVSRVHRYIGHKTTHKQSSLSGASHGRSTGAIKKSGANKRSGQGKEHGECLGASSRSVKHEVPVYQTEPTFKKYSTGKKLNTQFKHILEAYTALLELLK